jgi:glycosyltransferase involved in cell wall biosynthesis
MAAEPVVSVIMPLYNERAERLTRAVDSLLCQSFPEFELLLLDDGSTCPETRQWLGRWSGADPRIRCFHGRHRGLPATLNYGLGQVRAEFVCRHDADDWSEPRRLELQVRFLRAHPETVVVGSDILLHRENGGPLWAARLPHSAGEVSRCFSHANPFCHGATCFRASAARAIGGYREALDTSEDYDFFRRLCLGSTGVNLPEVLYHYRFVAGAVSSRRAVEQAVAHRAVHLLHGARGTAGEDQVRCALRQAERWCEEPHRRLDAPLRQADRMLLAGRYGTALRTYAGLIGGNPRRGKAWGKLLRSALFVAFPPLRKALFSTGALWGGGF